MFMYVPQMLWTVSALLLHRFSITLINQGQVETIPVPIECIDQSDQKAL